MEILVDFVADIDLAVVWHLIQQSKNVYINIFFSTFVQEKEKEYFFLILEIINAFYTTAESSNCHTSETLHGFSFRKRN